MPSKQTVELRSPDGSADIYKLFAGLVIATEHGLEMDDALKKAEDLYVDYNIFQNKDNQKRKTWNHCRHHAGNQLNVSWHRELILRRTEFFLPE